MITQQRVRIGTSVIAAILALGAAVLVGAATGYAAHGVAQSSGAVTAESAPARVANPGIGLHRADTDDAQSASSVAQPPAGASDRSAAGPVGAHNHGIGLHRDPGATGTASRGAE